jgi:ABC-type arginine transport system ATPase subunit
MTALRTLTRWVARTQRSTVDPFSALEVQLALARVERLIADLQRDDRRFARAHHLYSALAAYDRLLDEACRLADVPASDAVGDTRRLLAEVELRARGWTW